MGAIAAEITRYRERDHEPAAVWLSASALDRLKAELGEIPEEVWGLKVKHGYLQEQPFILEVAG